MLRILLCLLAMTAFGGCLEEPAVAGPAQGTPLGNALISAPVEAPSARHDFTEVTRLADCRILYNHVSAGIPEENLPEHASVPLPSGGGAYRVFLAHADTETGPVAEDLCIGFTNDDVRIGFSHNTTGQIPEDADRLFIAGDLLGAVDIAVLLDDAEPDPFGPWQSGPWITERERGPSLF